MLWPNWKRERTGAIVYSTFGIGFWRQEQFPIQFQIFALKSQTKIHVASSLLDFHYFTFCLLFKFCDFYYRRFQ